NCSVRAPMPGPISTAPVCLSIPAFWIMLFRILASIIKFCPKLFLKENPCASSISFVRFGVAIHLVVIVFLLDYLIHGHIKLLFCYLEHSEPFEKLFSVGMPDPKQFTKAIPSCSCLRTADKACRNQVFSRNAGVLFFKYGINALKRLPDCFSRCMFAPETFIMRMFCTGGFTVEESVAVTRCSLIGIMTDPVARLMRLRKYNDTTLSLCVPDLIYHIIIDCGSVCLNCISLHRLLDFRRIIASFHNNYFLYLHVYSSSHITIQTFAGSSSRN